MGRRSASGGAAVGPHGHRALRSLRSRRATDARRRTGAAGRSAGRRGAQPVSGIGCPTPTASRCSPRARPPSRPGSATVSTVAAPGCSSAAAPAGCSKPNGTSRTRAPPRTAGPPRALMASESAGRAGRSGGAPSRRRRTGRDDLVGVCVGRPGDRAGAARRSRRRGRRRPRRRRRLPVPDHLLRLQLAACGRRGAVPALPRRTAPGFHSEKAAPCSSSRRWTHARSPGRAAPRRGPRRRVNLRCQPHDGAASGRGPWAAARRRTGPRRRRSRT